MEKTLFDPAMWLNNVRAVPTIGVRFKVTIDTSSSLVQRLKTLLAKWNSTSPIKIGLMQDNSVKIERQDGVEVTVGPNKLVCKYFYISEIVEKGLLDPVIKLHNPRRPFEEICSNLQEIVHEVYVELCKDGNRNIEFVGIVAEGNLDADALPPGFTKLIDYFGRPWSAGLQEFKGKFLSGVGESDDFSERCHHFFDLKPDEESSVEFKLDWQRVLKASRDTNPARLNEEIGECKAAAVQYFGRFGLGDLNYGD